MKRRSFLGGGIIAACAAASGATGGGAMGGGAMGGEASAATPATPSAPESLFRGYTVERGSLHVNVGPTRIVMRGPMFPNLARFGEQTVLLFAAAAEEGGPLAAARSEDGGGTWRPQPAGVDGLGLNTMRLRDGSAISIHYDTKPIEGQQGLRSTRRWISKDLWKNVEGPLEDGTLLLAPDQFKAEEKQWFHGNVVEMPDGTLLAAMQGTHEPWQFRTFVSQSEDGGKNWRFLAHVASLDSIEDPKGVTKRGWRLWGPCEPNLVHLGEGRMLCIMRLVNDDADPLMGEPMETYHDLNTAVSGDGIHPGTLPADRFYAPGPPSAPLVASFSSDAGRTWSPARPMGEARGCFPRMAQSEGLVALTYGGLAYPRWGNCISFSTDGGNTWAPEINFAPCFTTGYTDILTLGPRRFLAVFDCTPPQPWKNHAAHWVGAVDITVSS